MPLATVHLISLKPSTTIADFVRALAAVDDVSLKEVLVISKVIRWIITPEQIDVSALLHPRKPWDLVVITLGGGGGGGGDNPAAAATTTLLPGGRLNTQHIECHWSAVAGIPSRLTNNFATTNRTLLHPAAAVPPLTAALANPRLGRSAQTLELSPALRDWACEFAQTRGSGGGGGSSSSSSSGAVSMLNLLSFLPGRHPSYLVYGRAFAESIGSRHGGRAKLVGTVVGVADGDSGKKGGTSTSTSTTSSVYNNKAAGWDEFALAHYPSILHFADMLASEDYQAVNLKYRVPSLRDTCILCTSEIAVEEELLLARKEDAKL